MINLQQSFKRSQKTHYYDHKWDNKWKFWLDAMFRRYNSRENPVRPYFYKLMGINTIWVCTTSYITGNLIIQRQITRNQLIDFICEYNQDITNDITWSKILFWFSLTTELHQSWT